MRLPNLGRLTGLGHTNSEALKSGFPYAPSLAERDLDSAYHAIREELREELQRNPRFDPAFPALGNPTLDYPSADCKQSGTNTFTNPATREAMATFNDLYVLAMRLLGWVFGPGAPHDPRTQSQTRAFARAGNGMMALILKPLGEALGRLPSGDGLHTSRAPFTLRRRVPFAEDAAVGQQLVFERISQLSQRASALLRYPELSQAQGWLPGQIGWLLKQLSP